jgi:hypothetical protein
MSTLRYPPGHVRLSRAPRTRTWCVVLCLWWWCASGWVVGEAGEVGSSFQFFRQLIRHRQTHFHKAQHTRRCIGFLIRYVVSEILHSCSRLSGVADSAAFQRFELVMDRSYIIITLQRCFCLPSSEKSFISLLHFRNHNLEIHEVTIVAKEHLQLRP